MVNSEGDIVKKREKAINKILEAGLNEFSEKGYDAASTNNIYKNAGVSKGAIFLYFNSKAELFYEIFKLNISNFLEEMNKQHFDKYGDLIERVIQISIWKMLYFSNKPIVSKFLIEAISKPPIEIEDKIFKQFEDLKRYSLDEFSNNIDMSQFSDDYSKEEVINYINYAIQGVQSTIINNKLNIDIIESKKNEIIKFIKTLLKGMKK